jgi:hypothetical protein
MVLFLFCSSVSMGNTDPRKVPGKEQIAIFLNFKNYRRVVLNKDSLEVSIKGTLLLGTLSHELKKTGAVNFWIVIRHRMDLGGIMVNKGDERYNDGEIFSSIEIEKILSKAKPGDQIIIVPVDKDSQYENTKTHFQINVIFGGC